MKLDDIRAAAEAKYGSLDIELSDGKTVRLLNPLRLPKEKRDAMVLLQENAKGDGVDQVEVMTEMIRLAAETKGGADLLLKAAGGDLTVLAEIVAEYGKQTRVGEASA